MVGLLDVNVLVALAWPNHVHHEPALHWFHQHQSEGWATCPVTQAGFVRVSSNQKALPSARSPAEALGLLAKIVALEHHEFWSDDTSLVDSEFISATRLQGYRQVTDAHLLALALRHGGCLATLDQGIRNLVPKDFDASEVVALLVPTAS